MSEEYKEEKTPVCSICGKTCREHKSNDPTWYGSYANEKMIKAICIDCWEKGNKWSK